MRMNQSFTQIAGEGFDVPVSCFVYTVPAFDGLDLVRVKADVMRPISPDRQIKRANFAMTRRHRLPTMAATVAQYKEKQNEEKKAVHSKIKHGLNLRTIPCATQGR
jgi:hypothetical protein